MSIEQVIISMFVVTGTAIILYMHMRFNSIEKSLQYRLKAIEDRLIRVIQEQSRRLEGIAVDHQRKVLREIDLLDFKMCAPREYILTPKDDSTD